MPFPHLAARYKRLLLKHLPVLVAGVLAGYIIGCNKLGIRGLLNLSQDMGGCHSNEPVADNSRPRAALVALVRNRELLGMRMAVRQIEDRFNRNYNYPYIFVNDQEFTEEFKEGIRALTNAEVSFGTLDSESWQVPEWINQTLYEEEKRTATYLHGGKDSYRKMCRFQSGYLHKHPLVADLDYYWRIEPDVEYYCDIDYDPFVYMRENGYKYGWTIAMPEFMPTVRTLWNTTMEFVNANQGLVAQNNMAEWLANGDAYNGCHFWSNFEIVDLSFYRSSTYQMFFDHLDRAGGFFYERWGDAPVHSIAAALFLNASQIHYFNDIGYYHPTILYCPQGSSTKGRCVCDEDKAFIHNTACTVRYKEVRQKIVEPEAKELAHTGPLVDFALSVEPKSQLRDANEVK